MAKIRLGLAILILAIPFLDRLMFQMDAKESLVGFGLAAGTLLFAATAYSLISRDFNPPWLGFVTSGFDITLVSAALAVFLLLDRPHTAVNSKVVFEGYFLAIASTSLRYDRRVCVTAGCLALGEYVSIVAYADRHWDLNSAVYAPFPYGMFDWSNQISRLILLSVAVGLSVAVVSRAQRLLKLATIDPLTSLCNRGYVDDRLAIEMSRARRHHQPLSVAMIDVDRFKLFNDTHGHAAGDLVLRTIADVLRSSLRQSDTIGRYGGEEFVVILPETSLANAERKIESLRRAIANDLIPLATRNEVVSVTISAGLAGFPDNGTDEAVLLATADERLFQAKREGRNRVVAAPPVNNPEAIPIEAAS